MFTEHHHGPRGHIHSLFAIGRHGRRHGFRGGGGGFWGAGGGGVPPSRKLSSAEVQLLLLALLDKAPAHGYELIRAIEERSGGFYAPSPGVIYPALTYLHEIGHAAAEADGNRKQYHLTDEGRGFLAANRERADGILDALARIGARMEGVREAFAGVDDADPAGSEDLHRARHALRHALIRKRGCAAEEARRIARILERACKEILDGPSPAP